MNEDEIVFQDMCFCDSIVSSDSVIFMHVSTWCCFKLHRKASNLFKALNSIFRVHLHSSVGKSYCKHIRLKIIVLYLFYLDQSTFELPD